MDEVQKSNNSESYRRQNLLESTIVILRDP
jgi:hypothetical protein